MVKSCGMLLRTKRFIREYVGKIIWTESHERASLMVVAICSNLLAQSGKGTTKKILHQPKSPFCPIISASVAVSKFCGSTQEI